MKKHNPYATLLALAISLVAVSSCGESRDADTAKKVLTKEELMLERLSAISDSLVGTQPTPMEKATHKFSSAQEAVEWMKASGDWDKYSQGIMPGIAGQHLEYANKLLSSTFPYFIIADKGQMDVMLFDRYGRHKMSFKMACSRYYGTKHKFRDNRTPEGYFTAEGAYDAREWLYTDDDGVTSQAKGVYGPRFIRLLTPITHSVGIHGTNSPYSPGLRCSHGCMRLHNSNIVKLTPYVQRGTPIIVNPSRRDDEVNRKEGYRIPMLNIAAMSPGKISSPLPELPVATAEEIAKREAEEAKAEQAKAAADTVSAAATENESED